MPRLMGEEHILSQGGYISTFDIVNLISPALLATLQSPTTVALNGTVTLNANYGYLSINSGTINNNASATVTVTNNKAQTAVHMMCPPIILTGTSYNDVNITMVPSIHRAGSFVILITNASGAAVNAGTTPLPVLFEAH